MQALSVWPLKSGPLVGSRLESDLDCSCSAVVSRKIRKRHCNGEQLACFGSSISSFVLDSSNNRTSKALFLCEPRRRLLGSSVGVGWATEQREEEEVSREDSSSRVNVRELAKSLRAAKTADDVDAVLKEKGELLPLQVYCAMIRGFGKDKRLKPAMAVVEWLKRKKSPNLFIYNSLLGAVKESNEFGETEKILSDMEEQGIAPNVVTYNTLMAIYTEEGEFGKALEVLDLVKEKGFEPSPVTYSTALLVYRRMEDGMGALEFFVELRERYSKKEIGNDDDAEHDWELEFVKLENFIGRICYQVMRRWLVKEDENMTTKVLKLLNAVDSAGLRPSREEHERLIWACTREEHYVVGKELYKRIRERFPEISLSVCNHLIWLMGKAKKWWAALEIYEDLLDQGPEPNNLSYELVVSHFSILLSAASKRGIWRWGVKLLNKMEDKGLKPQSRHWNAVLVACSKAAETAAAVQIFRAMVENGEKPTVISYGALLSALEKGKLYDEAFKVWNHMIKVGIEPNLHAYTIMASVLTGQSKFNLLETLFKEMASKGVEPSVVTYNAVISVCARKGSSGAAYEWFGRMRSEGVEANEITYEVLIEALADGGKPRLAYELHLKAQSEGLKLSAKAYDAVVISAESYGATIDVNLLGPRPEKEKRG
ncbi:Pentatricopeptide repeat-containing protein [Raphanus sativus]|uniref:Protein LOW PHOTOSYNTHETIC EFFICIENCY 1, chloroplastic-like n=1 Tax=Raphanus sativus TaxID=3726 RepID=A0A6J0MNH6_RAPSA|nr:protein LOW PHOTOSYNTHETIC EFFICIENCY 1, chloroplastic-like [Raphanus sativus]KAJ4908389.1 Pentatricopeptide repeat-containing protein [Raphanus sativus]